MPTPRDVKVQKCSDPKRLSIYRPTSTLTPMGSAISHPKDVKEPTVCQKEARRACCSLDAVSSVVIKGAGHLPVYPVEVLFRLLLQCGESLVFFTNFVLQLLQSMVESCHAS